MITLEVVAPVKARVGPIELRHFERTEDPYDPEASLPEAVLGWCRVEFVFDDRWVRSKVIKYAYRWADHLGWPRATAVSVNNVSAAYRLTAAHIAGRVLAHVGHDEATFEAHVLGEDGEVLEEFDVMSVNENLVP